MVNFTTYQGWEAVGPAVTQSSGSSFSGCKLSTRIGVGLDCGLGSQAYSPPAKTNATVCWLLSISTTHSIASSCASSSATCAQSSLTMIIPETLIDSDKTSVSCPATTVVPIACTGPSCNSRNLNLPATTLTASPDLSNAFTLADGSLCGGDFYTPNIGSTCLLIRYQLCQYVDGGEYFCIETSSSSSTGSFAIPGLWFGPSVLDAVSYGAPSYFPSFSRDNLKQTCSPWPLDLPLDYNGGRIIAPLLHQSLGHMGTNILSHAKLTSYLADALIEVSYLQVPINTVNDVAAQTKVGIGSSILASFW